jgi:transposase
MTPIKRRTAIQSILATGIATAIIPGRHARQIPFDREAYRDRNIVERLIGWLKESRRLFTRFEKTATNFGGMIRLAFIQRHLRLVA